MKMDTWYDLQSTNPAERWQGEIRVETQWIHSRVRFFSSLVKKLDQLLLADEQDRSNIEKHLSKVRAPFQYLDYMDQGHFNLDDVETAKKAADGGLKERWLLFEKRLSKSLDEIADNMGIRPAPWYKWFMVLFTVWFFLTLISLWIRPDFLDCTAVSILCYCHIMKH